VREGEKPPFFGGERFFPDWWAGSKMDMMVQTKRERGKREKNPKLSCVKVYKDSKKNFDLKNLCCNILDRF